MSRIARRLAGSGFYHVVIRGNGRRILFEKDEDKEFYLKLLERYGQQYEIEYLAWCLMENHVHLLICDATNSMGKAMHDISGLYASYYNRRHEHVGGVYQGRYSSRPIETDNDLLNVVRYIHQNPLKARLTKTLDYPWSSYDDYLRGGVLTSTKRVLELLGGVDGFREFCSRMDDDVSKQIEKDSMGRLTDAEALERAKRILGEGLFNKLDRLARRDRDECLYCLFVNGLYVNQIARITGFGRNIVRRACSNG